MKQLRDYMTTDDTDREGMTKPRINISVRTGFDVRLYAAKLEWTKDEGITKCQMSNPGGGSEIGPPRQFTAIRLPRRRPLPRKRSGKAGAIRVFISKKKVSSK